MAVTPLLRICQYIAFTIAIFANCFLLYLIIVRAGSSFGRYRVLMISFTVYSIFYATVEILTLPVLHLYQSGILIYVDSILKLYPSAGVLMITLYCGSFALCISMLATHFFYKYFAVCKHQRLHIFEGTKIYMLFIPPISLFVIWANSIYFNFGPNEIKKDYFRNLTKEIYDEDIDRIAFIAPLYFVRQRDGSRFFLWRDLLGVVISCTIMSGCFATCITCAYRTYRKLNDMSIEISKRTRKLNKQLFWTLGLQTMFPFFTQYIPVGLMFFVPFLEMDIGRIGNLVGVACSLYPAIDPFIAIFMIEKFRNFVLRKAPTTKFSQVSALTSDQGGPVTANN